MGVAMSIGIVLRVTLIVLTLFGVAAPARAQDAVAQFYKSRQITLVIPSSVGGGYDLYGRLVARHIGKYIPGNPNVVPSNMSGAAGVVAAQYTYSSGAKDGTVLAELYPNAIMAPLLGDAAQVKYDPLKFNYIGSASAETFICFVRADAPVNSFADALTHDVILGATGVGGSSTDYPALYDNLLGAKFKVIPGYPGITEIGLAIEKGEIDGTCGSSWSTMTTGHPEWLRDGKMRVHRAGEYHEPSRHRQARRAACRSALPRLPKRRADHGFRLHAVELRPALRDGAGSAGRRGSKPCGAPSPRPAGCRSPRRSQEDESRYR